MNNLIKKALQTLTRDERLAKFGTTKMIDSTTVSMCLTFFDWAKFRSTKAGIKMHTSIDGQQVSLTALFFLMQHVMTAQKWMNL